MEKKWFYNLKIKENKILLTSIVLSFVNAIVSILSDSDDFLFSK